MLSRRDFLRIAGVSTGAALLNACAPKVILPTSTLSPSATIAPTGTPAPTITPTATPDINTLLKPEIDLYANAYEYVAEDVANRISIVNMVDLSGNKFQVVIDPTTSIPLLVTNENGAWQSAFLKEIARHGKIRIRQEFDDSYNGIDVLRYDDILKKDFNSGVISSVWKWIEQKENTDPRTFTVNYEHWCLFVGDEVGINDFRMNCLIAPHKFLLPDWLVERIDKGPHIQRDELITIMTGYIKAIMPLFKGKIQEYVVVNEPFDNPPYNDDQLIHIIGEDYIDIAFQAAREADPNATLMFNWDDNYWANGKNTKRTLDIVRRLAGKGLIDKVGMQMHINTTTMQIDFDHQDVIKTIKSMGIPCAITEFDVDISDITGSQHERFMRQAQVYENMIGAALDAGVTDLGFWGTCDRKSWLESVDYSNQPNANPDMWDDSFNPKPAYYAVRKVLLAAVGKPA